MFAPLSASSDFFNPEPETTLLSGAKIAHPPHVRSLIEIEIPDHDQFHECEDQENIGEYIEFADQTFRNLHRSSNNLLKFTALFAPLKISSAAVPFKLARSCSLSYYSLDNLVLTPNLLLYFILRV